MDTELLVVDFTRVAAMAGVEVGRGQLTVESLPAPHRPPTRLPAGCLAVYVFHLGDECLKVGKVGANSGPRYTSQHYLPNSAPSTLARSILAHAGEFGLDDLDATTVGPWMKQHLDRHNFLLDAQLGVPTLTLLESFLQCRLRPRFEGFASQR